MPIIVNELVFRGTIAAPATTSGARAAPSERNPAIDREELVQTCVEEILRILARQKER
jgi:hypothetical protein